MVPGRLRRASRLGACARRLVWRPGLGSGLHQWQAALRLGAARLARAVLPRLAPLLGQLLGALQPPARNRREPARERTPDAPCQSRGAGCAVGRSRDVARRTRVREVESRERSRATRIVGAADADDSLGRLRATASALRGAGRRHSSTRSVHVCEGAATGRDLLGSLASSNRSRESERIHARWGQPGAGRDNGSARARERPISAPAKATRCGRACAGAAPGPGGGESAAAATNARGATAAPIAEPPTARNGRGAAKNSHCATGADARGSPGTDCAGRAGIGRAAAECAGPGVARRCEQCEGWPLGIRAGRRGRGDNGPAVKQVAVDGAEGAR